MIKFNSDVIRARIAEVARTEAELPDSVAENVAFHMTDWLDDLQALLQFYGEPSRPSDAEVSKLLTGFLVHVPNHLAAAGKLYTGLPVTDLFGVGATSVDNDEVG